MGSVSSIEWTDASWNPVRARGDGKLGWHCERVSPGCEHCYAERLNGRLGTGLKYTVPNRQQVELFLDEKTLTAPLRWRKPRKIFVGSMTDLFGEFVPDAWLDRIFAVMALSQRHQFQLLTKRSKRMREYILNARCRIERRIDDQRDNGEGHSQPIPNRSEGRFSNLPSSNLAARLAWPLPNCWLGVSAEDQQRLDERVPELLATPAALRFVSAEPLLGPLDLSKFLSYDPNHEHNQERRRVDLRDGKTWRTGDRLRGADMAHREARLGPMEQSRQNESLQAIQGGEIESDIGISDGEGHGAQTPNDWTSLTPHLATFQRPPSGGDDDQSSERNQDGQSAKEPGAGHTIREHQTRDSDSSSGPDSQPVGRDESCSKADNGPGDGDTSSSSERGAAAPACGRVRSGVSNGLPDRSWRQARLWVIVGGESGPGARPMDIAWARDIVRQCREAGAPVFVKQMGRWVLGNDVGFAVNDWLLSVGRAFRPPMIGRGARRRHPEAIGFSLFDPKGGDPSGWPEDLRVRQFPEVRPLNSCVSR